MGAQKIYLEESRNKVTSLSNESTDTQYPSAKCMYDAMMLANQALQSKENVSAKVTSITSSSTDTQYPSAKCVYDSITGNRNLLDNPWFTINSRGVTSGSINTDFFFRQVEKNIFNFFCRYLGNNK